MGEDNLLSVHPLPMFTAILRTIDGIGLISGIDDVGIVRMERQRPDVCPLLGGFQSLPVLPPIVAAIWPSMRAGIQNRWILGVHEQRPHLWVFR
jgi:hypothetical protein